MIGKLLLGLSLATSLAGCNASVTDFVKGAVPGGANQPDAPLPANGPTQLKISPGQMRATGPGASMVGNVTPTQQFMTSPQVSARLGISRSRASQ